MGSDRGGNRGGRSRNSGEQFGETLVVEWNATAIELKIVHIGGGKTIDAIHQKILESCSSTWRIRSDTETIYELNVYINLKDKWKRNMIAEQLNVFI